MIMGLIMVVLIMMVLTMTVFDSDDFYYAGVDADDADLEQQL